MLIFNRSRSTSSPIGSNSRDDRDPTTYIHGLIRLREVRILLEPE